MTVIIEVILKTCTENNYISSSATKPVCWLSNECFILNLAAACNKNDQANIAWFTSTRDKGIEKDC